MRPYSWLFVFFISFFANAQDGNLALRHFSPPLSETNHVFYDVNKDVKGRILLAAKNGILHFDGKRWLKIETKSSPITLVSSGKDYFCITKNGIEELNYDEFFTISSRQVFKNPSLSGIGSKLIQKKDDYYYLLDQKVFKLLKTKEEVFQVDTVFESKLGFKDLFLYENELFAVEGNYIVSFQNASWIDLNLYAPKKKDFLFSVPVNESAYFFYDNGDVYEFNGEAFSKLGAEITNYLSNHYPVSAIANNDYLIISTLTGGAIVINLSNKRIQYSLNYQTGLPDNEVMSAYIDESNSLWLAHKSGLSIANLQSGISSFHNYPFLKGDLKSSTFFNDVLYVGTSQGLYFLDTLSEIVSKEKTITVKKKVTPSIQFEEKPKDDSKGLFGGLFQSETSEKERFIDSKLKKYKDQLRNKGIFFSKLRDELSIREEQIRDSLARSGNEEYRYVERRVKEEKAVFSGYGYKKVALEEKEVSYLVRTSVGLMIIHADGIFRLQGRNKVEKLSSIRFIKSIQVNESSNSIWINHRSGIFRFSLETFKSELIIKGSYDDFAVSRQYLAVAQDNIIRKYKISSLEAGVVKSWTIENPYLDDLLLFFSNENLQLLKNGQPFSLKDEIKVKNRSEAILATHKDFRGEVWVRSNANWKKLLADKNDSKQLNSVSYLPIKYKNLQYYHRVNDSLSVIVAEKQLFKFNANRQYSAVDSLQSFVAGLSDGSVITKDSVIQLSYRDNSLRLVLSSPEFIHQEAIQHRFRIKSLNPEWSQWKEDPVVEIPFIPIGEYSMSIEIRNGVTEQLGRITYKIEVIPPYWQQWWFYVIEIIFFSTLIIISIRLNKSSRNTYLTNAITFLTLILFLEFISTVLENNLENFIDDSPVYQFGLNVILALSITPLERFINGVLLRINTRKAKMLIRKMRKSK